MRRLAFRKRLSGYIDIRIWRLRNVLRGTLLQKCNRFLSSQDDKER